MTRYELLKLNEGLIKLILSNSVNLKDVEYLQLYEQYVEMKAKHKVTYVVFHLADKYKITERAVYGIIKRFEKSMKM